MLTLFISILISIACRFALLETTGMSRGASTTWASVAFLASLVLIGYLVRKKSAKIQDQLQEIMLNGQKRITRMVNQFQSKPGGNPTQMQRQLEAEQKTMMKQALDFTVNFEPLKKWNLLMGRQIATMRLQFCYQLKEFKQVDELLASRGLFTGPLLMEPIAVAMKMARQYENKQFAAAEKTFKWHSKWFRGDRATLLYGLMSWIHMKNGDSEKARQVLLKGKESTGNETLAKNWELLSNLKDSKFSNKGLGDEWYALSLEKLPMPKQKRMRGQAQGHGRF